jgi:ubiquinone/menaquinone biosynthesis C-methylase UbiE
VICALRATVVWGIDLSPLYSTMDAIGQAKAGETVLDVPCGGGVAFRALRPDQKVRYIAADLSEPMLVLARGRAEARGLGQVEFVRADMQKLPFADGLADLFLSYSGVHMVHDGESAVGEIGRCLKPGGTLIGCTLLSGGTRRQRGLFAAGQVLGHAVPPRASDLRGWLTDAGMVEPTIEPTRGFGVFRATKLVA